MSDNTQGLREKILKVCHKYEDKEFMAVHGKCDMDLAALRCAKRVKELEALIKSQTNQAVLEALDRVEKEVIGAIEPSYDTENPWEADKRHGANILRAEQRKKLATLRKELTQEVQTDES